jgi:hypothetical protein
MCLLFCGSITSWISLQGLSCDTSSLSRKLIGVMVPRRALQGETCCAQVYVTEAKLCIFSVGKDCSVVCWVTDCGTLAFLVPLLWG